jgi:hypothetical protein
MKRAFLAFSVCVSIVSASLVSASPATPGIVLEGGINTPEGFTPFSVDPITVTTRYPFDIVTAVYNQGDVAGARLTVSGHRSWNATVSGSSGKSEFVGTGEWGLWVFEGPFSGIGPIELVVRSNTPPPYRPSNPWSIDVAATPLGTGDWQTRHALIQNSRWGWFLPFVSRG